MIDKLEKYDKGIHYFYKITNLINGKFYYGVRKSHCLPGSDPYMGSGTHLHRAINKYGIQNFKKVILRVVPTRIDALDLERWIVDDEMVKNPMCYNHSLGGGETSVFDGVTIVNDNGSYSIISMDEYRTGNYKSHISGKCCVYDLIDKKWVWVTSEIYHLNLNRYSSNEGNRKTYSTKGMISVYDPVLGKNTLVSVNDDRYRSGELSTPWKGRHHSEESKKRISASGSMRKGSMNSMYGTHYKWINNGKENRRCPPDLLKSFTSKGWKVGKINIGTRIIRPRIVKVKLTKCKKTVKNTDSNVKIKTIASNKGYINITN